ncbi:hypothetical protein ACHAXA_004441 [Cyclostephanos tholiformis]|uniref:Uncharacterized protein n=1 Tax=Cyclostephanos tholiformis TaxID=382380 RepID=A0ABD3SC96_9STRA
MIRPSSLIAVFRPTTTRRCHHHHRRGMGWVGTTTRGILVAFPSSSSSSSRLPRRRSPLLRPPRTHRAISHRRLSIDATEGDDVNDVGEENRSLITMRTKRGEELYALAGEAMHRAEEARRRREDRLLREQYDAADARRRRGAKGERGAGRKGGGDESLAAGKPKGRNEVDRSAGIAVVRTIVNQARGEMDAVAAVRVNRSNGGPRRRLQDVDVPTPPPLTYDDDHDDSARVIEGGVADRRPPVDDEDEEYWRRTARERMEESALRYGHGSALVRLGNDALELAGGGGSSPGRELSNPSSSSLLIVDREKCEGWIGESPLVRLPKILEVANAAVAREGDSGDDDGDDDNDVSKKYLRLARYLYAEAGERGSTEGWYNLGHLLWDECEYDGAMKSFHRAMKMGDSDATYFVAAQYLSYEEDDIEGKDGVEHGRHFLKESYERYGSAFATSPPSMASATTTMPFLSNDVQRHGYALLLHAAHHHGHGPALHHLALHFNQHGNMADFHRLLSAAADVGNADSLFLRGHCRYFGTDGHDRDILAAMEDFMASAESGNADAMVSAGAILHRGVRSDDGRTILVERDQRRAFEIYQQAGELGSMEGWRNVVSCYATGQGVPKCMDTAKYIANTMLREEKGY